MMMRFAYADPPYLGLGRFYADRHSEALTWDKPETHLALIKRLTEEYGDGWALSATSGSLRVLLPMCPDDVRVCAWVKPFSVFKPGVKPAYAWEPVLLRGGRKSGKRGETTRDWVSANASLGGRDFKGAKPREFCRWLFRMLGAECGDQFDDLFPGSGAVSAAWAEWVGEQSPLPQLPLETVVSAPAVCAPGDDNAR